MDVLTPKAGSPQGNQCEMLGREATAQRIRLAVSEPAERFFGKMVPGRPVQEPGPWMIEDLMWQHQRWVHRRVTGVKCWGAQGSFRGICLVASDRQNVFLAR